MFCILLVLLAAIRADDLIGNVSNCNPIVAAITPHRKQITITITVRQVLFHRLPPLVSVQHEEQSTTDRGSGQQLFFVCVFGGLRRVALEGGWCAFSLDSGDRVW